MILEKEFVEIVEARLAELGWSRSELARQMGVGRSVVTDYLNRRSRPGLDVVERFFAALGLTAHLKFDKQRDPDGARVAS